MRGFSTLLTSCLVCSLIAACHGDYAGSGAPWPIDLTEPEADTNTGTAQGDGSAEPTDEPEPEPPADPEPSAPDPADPGIPAAEPEPDPDPVFGGGSACSSGELASGDDKESPNMSPGQACIGCHALEDEAPRFEFAGTVYRTGHEPDDCAGGPEGGEAKIEVTDAEGKVVTIRANRVGNFFTSSSVTFPIRARVLFEGRVRSMAGAVPSGDCNSCHTEAGTNGAPGRIALP